MDAYKHFNNCIGVFQGGGCKAIAYVGAYKQAHQYGIMFSEVAGTSAGSIFAAMIAIGCSPEKLEKLVMDTDFKKLLKSPKSDKGWFKRAGASVISFLAAFIVCILVCLITIIIFIYIFLKSPCKTIHSIKRNNTSDTKSDSSIKRIFNYTYKSIYSLCLNIWGLYDSKVISDLIEDWIKKCGKNPNIKFSDLDISLKIVSTDIKTHNPQIWSTEKKTDEKISTAVAASCSIPVFFTPINGQYVDGGVISNRPDYLYAKESHKYPKILSFVLASPQKESNNLVEFLKELCSTVIDGSDALQHNILPKIVKPIEIPYCGIDATDFDKLTPENKMRLISAGENAMKSYIETLQSGGELEKIFTEATGTLKSRDQVYATVAMWSYFKFKEIIVYENTLDWVWSLFPTLLMWINNGTKVIVFSEDKNLTESSSGILNTIKASKPNGCTTKEAKELANTRLQIRDARIRLLESLGCKVFKFNENKIKGFFFKAQNKPDEKGVFRCISINYTKEISSIIQNNNLEAKIYADDIDAKIITQQIAATKLDSYFSGMSKPAPIKIEPIANREIEDKLRNISYYKNATFEWREVELTELLFLNPMLREFKYTQCEHTYNLCKENNFNASAVVLSNGKKSIISPIIVEVHDGKMYVIKGNTRCLYAWRHERTRLNVLTISNVLESLPIKGDVITYKIDSMFVSNKDISGEKRYGKNFDQSKFRPIEETLRPNDTYLI